mmetsp:Transcript_37837/g.68390  ORF Transcript_37837/g.68390 Transcript_37837/m.68390 type:complete len:150 (+) Transcript_37837:71-520(+)
MAPSPLDTPTDMSVGIPPGPQTPSVSPADSDVEMLDVVAETPVLIASSPVTIQADSRSKRMRLDKGSQTSTAATTPSTTPGTSPMPSPSLKAQGEEKQCLRSYEKWSEHELRERLGVIGTDIAEGWEKAELVAVLEELDKILPMPTLTI